MKDKFYPPIPHFNDFNLGIMIGLPLKLRGHLAAAKAGDRDRESRLINWLGRIRVSADTKFNDLPAELREAMKESCDWLRTQGRIVNFRDPDPARWVTTRDGQPRWPSTP